MVFTGPSSTVLQTQRVRPSIPLPILQVSILMATNAPKAPRSFLDIRNGAQNQDVQSINNRLYAANLFTWTIHPELAGYNFQLTYAGDQDAIKARSFLVFVTDSPATLPNQDTLRTWMGQNIADEGDSILTN